MKKRVKQYKEKIMNLFNSKCVTDKEYDALIKNRGKSDKHKPYSLAGYLDDILPYLKDITNDL